MIILDSVISRLSGCFLAVLTAMLLAAGGCHIPARVFWSPDATRAVYINYGQVAVIDAQGAIQFQAIGEGTAAWSADGKTAYFALSTDAVPAVPLVPTVYQTGWAGGPVAPPADPAEELQAVVAYGPDGVQPLFVLDQPVMHLHLSPDENWLAVVTSVPEGEGTMTLFAWHLPSRTLYLIERKSGFAAAFTGDSRLAYSLPGDPDRPPANQPSNLIEVILDVTRDQLERQTLLDVQAGTAVWIQPLDSDILLSVAWHDGNAFDPKIHPMRIIRYRRDGAGENDGSEIFADWTGGLFAISPDQKRILFERITPRKGAAPKVELMIMETGGGNPRVLRDVTQHVMTQPMWPSWRGNDQITFTPSPAGDDPVDPLDPEWRRTEVILYDLTDNGGIPLRAVKTLSADWEAELKPRYRRTE